MRKVLEDTAQETQAFVYQTAAQEESELLGKLKQAGMQVNEVDKDAFIKASKPIYDEFAQGSRRRQAADRQGRGAGQVARRHADGTAPRAARSNASADRYGRFLEMVVIVADGPARASR